MFRRQKPEPVNRDDYAYLVQRVEILQAGFAALERSLEERLAELRRQLAAHYGFNVEERK